MKQKHRLFPFKNADDAAESLAIMYHLSDYSIQAQSVSKKGDNHTGEIFRVTIRGVQSKRYCVTNNNIENLLRESMARKFLKRDGRVEVPVEKNTAKTNCNSSPKENGPLLKIVGAIKKYGAVAPGGVAEPYRPADMEHLRAENIIDVDELVSSDVTFYNPKDFQGFPFAKDEEVEKTFIFKIASQSKIRRKQQNINSYFEREVFMYTKVLSRFMEIQSEHDIEKKIEFPRMYAYSLKELEEFIILEDLDAVGYKMYSRHISADFNHASLVMNNIAKFHALSFAMKTKYPEEYEEFKSMVDTTYTEPMPELYKMYYDASFVKAIETLDEHEEDLVDKMKDFQINYVDTMVKLTQGKFAEPLSCVTHGDFWNNNMMFGYNWEGPPCSVKFIDFQMSRYSTPVLDIMYYLFCCTDSIFRSNHYFEMLNIYYISFSQMFKQLGCVPDDLMTYRQFLEEVVKYGIFGLCQAVIALVFFITSEEDNLSVDDIAEKVERSDCKRVVLSITEGTQKKYTNRMSDVIRDASSYRYFDNYVHF